MRWVGRFRNRVCGVSRWIERIVLTNFPQAVQIVDWYHASGCLWTVGQALYGEGSKQTKEWVGKRLDDLWQGKGWAVVGDLQALDLDQHQVPDEVRQAPGYFESNLARMRYDQFRAEGYPIGSGTVESSCNNTSERYCQQAVGLGAYQIPGWRNVSKDGLRADLPEFRSGIRRLGIRCQGGHSLV